MAESMSFGGYFRQLRAQQRKSLRDFCMEHGFDPGNVSKLERGVMSPPKSDEVLNRYARALGLVEASKEWMEFHHLASIGAGRIPSDIMSDEEALAKLPVLFRALRGQRMTSAKAEKLVELIKSS